MLNIETRQAIQIWRNEIDKLPPSHYLLKNTSGIHQSSFNRCQINCLSSSTIPHACMYFLSNNTCNHFLHKTTVNDQAWSVFQCSTVTYPLPNLQESTFIHTHVIHMYNVRIAFHYAVFSRHYCDMRHVLIFYHTGACYIPLNKADRQPWNATYLWPWNLRSGRIFDSTFMKEMSSTWNITVHFAATKYSSTWANDKHTPKQVTQM